MFRNAITSDAPRYMKIVLGFPDKSGKPVNFTKKIYDRKTDNRWLKPFFCQQKRDRIGIEDLYDVSVENNSHHLGSKLESCWDKELNQCSATKRNPSLFKASWETFGRSFLYHSIHVFIICVILRGFQPYVLARVIRHFEIRADKSTHELYFDATALLIMILLQALLGHHSVVGRKLVGMRMSIAYSSLIYRKMLRLSIAASNNYNSGKIMNLLSNDVDKFENLSMFLHYIWILPIQGIVMGYFIWDNIGVASLSGVLFLVLQSIPIQGYLARMTAKLRAKAANRTDERVRLMSEIVNGIRLIKMYVWEKPFEDMIFRARRSEVNAIGKKSYLRGVSAATSVFAESTSLFFVIAACVLLGKPLQASMVYSLAQYFGMMKVMMTVFYPRAMSSAAEARVSIKRIEEFLLLDEVSIRETCDVVDDNYARGVFIKDVKVSWHKKSKDYVLDGISLELSNEKLYIVTGAVGSGKSMLLTTILGELIPIEGKLQVNGSISYACQESWLFPSTVRANIIFGRTFDEERYQRVIDACELKDDLDKLPNGDLTVVGDRGSTLSGGQCARVNLARAVYKDADIYLIDDALAAVDVHVGRNLFDKCINGLLKNKIRVLITHNSEYFDKADEIIILENACVKFQGLWSDFKSQGNYLDETVPSRSFSKEPRTEKTNSSANVNNDLTLVKSKIEQRSFDVNDDQIKKIDETNYVWEYFRAGGSIFILSFLLIILILGQVSVSTCDYWLAQWIQQEETNSLKSHSNNTYKSALIVFASLLFASVVTWTASTFLFYKVCMNASKNLHNRMFSRLLAAPINFFDLNNSGKILNRFSKDTGLVDETLPTVTLDALRVILMVSGVVVQVLIISWWMLFPIVVVVVICWKFKNIYLPVAQDMRRLESEAKGPIFSHVSSTVFGLTTIRSAKMQRKVKKEFDSLQNIHTSAHHLNIVSASAFGFWLDIVSISLLAFVIFGFTLFKDDDTFAGIVGLAITQILMLYGTVQYGLRQITEMMTQMISVERIFEFTSLEQEGPFENNVSLECWPEKGKIEFDNLRLKYFDDKEAVLKSISIHINPREKIGIIGRTGSGKTSLISALFRLYNYEGSIHIDGVNIKTRGLSDVRSKISVIPQIPTLFTATVKQNLDPLDQYNNQALWQALEDVGLKDRFDSLDCRIENGGNNLSTGERQLFCLARAIIANNKIVILDEATANVDSFTDRLIRRIIEKKFTDCTILTIAHRLNTVMDSDKILVLDYGEVVGFDKPTNLAIKTNGSFFGSDSI